MLEKIEMKIVMFFTSIMPYKDPEARRACALASYHKHKDTRKEARAKWSKGYKQTPEGKKATRLVHWRKRGVVCDDFDALYEKYLNTTHCEECRVELTEGNTAKGRCLDHDHTTGLFRNVLCRACNVRRG